MHCGIKIARTDPQDPIHPPDIDTHPTPQSYDIAFQAAATAESRWAIPSDHVDEEYLTAPRKWNIDNIRRFMIRIGPISSIFDYATFFLMLYFFKCKFYSNAATPPAMKTYYESLSHTGWFVESILTQTLIVHIIRTPRIPFFQSVASPFLLFTTALVMIVGAVLPYSPFADYFGLCLCPEFIGCGSRLPALLCVHDSHRERYGSTENTAWINMKSLLTALQEGRLIELPDNNKNKALDYLATLIEAIPDIGFGGGLRKACSRANKLTIPASAKAGHVLMRGRLVMANLFAQLAGVQRESTMVHPTGSP